MDEAARLLQQTLDEEKNADKKINIAGLNRSSITVQLQNRVTITIRTGNDDDREDDDRNNTLNPDGTRYVDTTRVAQVQQAIVPAMILP